ncbi:MAG: hypothetical protein JSV88_20045 [Candidatus Aminicenantes bacterium]|nr:MAG: hypothetical protein JSV88_20045 [Candidatus Aminicenantes bacterium]
MTEKPDFITIFAGGEPEGSSPTVTRRLGDTVKSAAAKVSQVTVDTLQKNFRRFFESLDKIISASPKDVGGLTLDEVEIQAQIDSKGNIGISGIVEAEFAVQGGIKFVLRKKV